LDKTVQVPAGTRIGVDREQDARRFFVSEGGIVVIPGVRTRVELSGVAV